jgi:hypothetical protein
MVKYDLSILIPSRNEQFLAKTIEDILEHKEGRTEIIAGLDGEWADPGIDDHPDVTLVYYPESLGQRAMTNQLCKLSRAKYVAKVDAHTAYDQGFDVKLMQAMEGHDDWTIVPIMRNLHAFNWVCPDGHSRYQGPSGPCVTCSKPTTKDIVWIPKQSPQSKSYRFDKTLHFQYFGEYCKRPEYKKDLEDTGITSTMSLQGSFFMLTREKYWELNICDEKHGSWGQQGVEVACKTWLSGGEVKCLHSTWYAHMFRTQGGDFSFPYVNPGSEIEKARKYSRELWFKNKWPLAKHKLHWLVDKFSPVPDWGPSKGIIFYTDNRVPEKIAKKVQKNLENIAKKQGMEIVSASLKPMNFGKNIHIEAERGILTMFRQILAALEASTAEIIFHCEHDVLYVPEHFDFTPPQKDQFYYNQNFWRVRKDGFAVHWDANQVSGLVAYRNHLIAWYKEKIKQVEADEFNRSYEPGGRDKSQFTTYQSTRPNIDIRGDWNLTSSKWSKADFRDKSTCVNWREGTVDNVPGWTKDQFKDIIS